MSNNIAELERRVAALENLLQKQNEQIDSLGAVALSSGHQALFVDPLQAFFDAPEFWEVVIPDNVKRYLLQRVPQGLARRAC